MLYETVIPPDERRQLGEYYTPAWLARVMVRELVEQPLEQRVLDPACGSGTFVVEAVAHFLAAAEREGREPGATLERLLDAVTGVDVHPVAVHLARAAWVLAARPAIQAASDAGYSEPIAVPVYLGDALQLRYYGDLFAQRDVPVYVDDERNTVLRFPRRLVEQANAFDALMSDIAGAIESGNDPTLALDDHGIGDAEERDTLQGTIAEMQRLHAEGSDHIWAYYSRNLVRPVALAQRKVDVVIGNPPWLNYNKTASTLRTALEQQSKNEYDIWTGGRYATQSGRSGAVLHAQRRPVPEGWGRDRHGAAAQCPANRAVRQVAQRRVARGRGWERADGGLQLQGGLGPGKAGTEHLLSHRGGGGLCPADGRREPGGGGGAAHRPGGTLAGQDGYG